MEAFWGWLGLGTVIFLCYAGDALHKWVSQRCQKQDC